jgi:hypothetical protein
MTFGHMRELGVHHLIAFCHTTGISNRSLIEVSNYANDGDLTHWPRSLDALAAHFLRTICLLDQ